MAKAAQPAVTTDEIAFELERFEREGDRLILSGRWFGVRGRRFVRPTLIPLGGHDLFRVLADLEHKPWAAEDGEHWEAAFHWDQNGGVNKFELSVAPDIAIELPSPSAKLGRPRRLAALPRRPLITPAWRQPEDQAQDVSPPASEVEPSHGELEAAQAQLEATKAELEATRTQLADRERELESARVELSSALADHDAAARHAADGSTTRDQLAIELDQLARERDQLTGDLVLAERTVTELRSELEQTRLALADAERRREDAALERDEAARQRDEAVHQRDQAITARGAALVMRGATRAAPHHEHRHGWWGLALAILAFVAVVFAILIVVHVL